MKIKKLTLFTSQLSKQTHFYNEVLGFSILDSGKAFVEFSTGDSILRFEEKEMSTPYHFAFNIPSNQIAAAMEWLKKRTSIIKNDGLEIIPFDFWDAEAVYFYDADNNIVEFIARKKLTIESNEPFLVESIISISEIGIPVNDIQPVFNQLNEKLFLEIHSGSVDRFCAIGAESGLFIIIDKTKKKTWFPTDDSPYSSAFNAVVENKGKYYKVRFLNQNLYTHELKSSHRSFAEFAESC